MPWLRSESIHRFIILPIALFVSSLVVYADHPIDMPANPVHACGRRNAADCARLATERIDPALLVAAWGSKLAREHVYSTGYFRGLRRRFGVSRMVQSGGGSVRAKSPGLGQGATFVIALPVAARVP